MKRGIHGHPAMDDAAGFDRKNAQVRSYYSGFRAVRRRYSELCMVSPAASRRAGFFPCMPCICRVIDGCVNFIGARYRYEPGLSSSTRRLRYACSLRASRHERASHFPQSDKSTAQHRYSRSWRWIRNHERTNHWTSLSYSDIFCRVMHHRTREQVSYHPLRDLYCHKKKDRRMQHDRCVLLIRWIVCKPTNNFCWFYH